MTAKKLAELIAKLRVIKEGLDAQPLTKEEADFILVLITRNWRGEDG